MIKGQHSFFNNMRALIPDLPSTWDTTHHLHRLYPRAMEETKCKWLVDLVTSMEQIAHWFAYPSRWTFLQAMAAEFGKPLFDFGRVGPTSWVPSARIYMTVL